MDGHHLGGHTQREHAAHKHEDHEADAEDRTIRRWHALEREVGQFGLLPKAPVYPDAEADQQRHRDERVDEEEPAHASGQGVSQCSQGVARPPL